MLRVRSAALVCALAVLAATTHAQDAALAPDSSPAATTAPGADLADSLRVPEGLVVTLAAESPLLFNPTAMDVDSRGRLWVTEAVNYRRWDGRNPGLSHPEGDRVVILEDQNGDGVYESSKVFVQEPGLVAPLGIAVLGRQVYVSCSPDLIVYTDADGDDVPDDRSVLLTGFGGHDHDHGLHSAVAGPDGYLYLAVGNAGPHLVTDRSGWTLRSGSLYTGGGAVPADNKPGLVSDDGRLWTGGLLLRVAEDGTGLSVRAHNFRNNYEVALDAFGNLYQSDNDDDGNQGCRVLWCLPGGDHGYFSADGSRYWAADRRPGQSTPTAHWHQDDPGVAPAGTLTGAGGPTGVAVYEAELLAPWIDGRVLAADAGAGVVYALRPEPAGAGMALRPDAVQRVQRGPGAQSAQRAQGAQGADAESRAQPAPRAGTLIDARDGDERPGAAWFRPSDVVVDVDGSVLVADWYDPGVGGHAAGDREAYGRILRIAPPGHLRIVPLLDPWTIDGALAALGHPAVNVRHAALATLDAGGEQAFNALMLAVIQGDAPRLRARALWALARQGETSLAALQMFLEDRDPQIRLTALRAARALLAERHGSRLLALLDPLVDDPSPAVRAEMLLALAGVPFPAARELLVRLALTLDPADRVLVEAFGLACAGSEAEMLAAAAEAFGLDEEQLARGLGDARFEALAWRLHPLPAVPWLAARAASADLPREQRVRAIDALAFVAERPAAEAMLRLALTGPPDTSELCRWWLEHRAGNDWRAYHIMPALQPQGLAAAESIWSSALLRRGSEALDLDVSGAEVLWLLVHDGGDGNSCDWADWLEPRLLVGAGAAGGAEPRAAGAADTAPGVPAADTAPDTVPAGGAASTVSLLDLPWLSASAAWGEVRRGRNCEGGPLSVDGEVTQDGLGTHAASAIAYPLPPGSQRLLARVAVDDGGTQQRADAPTSVVFEVRLQRPPARARLDALVATLLDPAAADEARLEAALALAADAAGASRLLDLLARGALDGWPGWDEPARAEVGEQLFLHPDHAVRALASEYLPRPAADGQLPPVAALLALPGDPVAGRDVFLDPRTQCVGCHAITRDGSRRGGDIGPELTAIRTKLGRAELLDAILNPSAGIAFGYEASSWRLADGEVLDGFLLAADAERLLVKDTRGRRHVLPAADVVETRRHAVSTMPEGLSAGLGAQQLADLLAFLLEDASAPLRRGEPIALFDGRSLAGWRFVSAAPAGGDAGAGAQAGAEEAGSARGADSADAGGAAPNPWSVAGGVLRCEGAPVGYLCTTERFTNFELHVRWRFDPARGAGNSGVLLRVVGADEVWPKSIEAQLHAGDAGDLWNIGAFGMATDPGRTDGRRTSRAQPSSERPLGEWNDYRIVLDRGRLTLEVNGVLQNAAAWCDELPGAIALQSEGAYIEFERVELVPLVR